MKFNKLKVLYVVNVPSSYKVSFFNELGKYCELTVLFEKYKSDARKKIWHDYNFTNFKGVFLAGIKTSSDASFSPQVCSYLISNEYKIIVIGNYATPTGIFSIYTLTRRSIPFLISVDGGLIDYEESQLKKKLKEKLVSSATAWLSTGEVTNEYLTYYGAIKEKIYIYPFTTLKEKDILTKPLTIDEKESIRDELKIPHKNMVISVGSFDYRKGFDLLIQASKHFNEDTGVYIIGGVPTKEYIELINRYDIKNVYFINFLGHEELKRYYLAADIFVFPTREDIWGLVINEAMANGLPVVTTTRCVAGMEMIEEGINGYLIPKDNVEEIIKKTNLFLSNEKLQNNMALRSLEIVKKYTIENMAVDTMSILSTLRQSM